MMISTARARRRGATRSLYLAMGTALLTVLTSAGPALAFFVTNAPSADFAAKSLLADPTVLGGASGYGSPSLDSATVMVSDVPLAGFPTNGSSYLVLSSGKASDIFNDNSSGSSGTGFGSAHHRRDTDYDVTVFQFDVNVPNGMNCLTGVDFRFLSEEYPEYVGSGYNDAFIAEIDVSDWTTSGSVITAPHNFAFDPDGKPISINGTGVTTMKPDQAVGTTFDGATPILKAASPISPGKHTIYLSIFDQGDNVYDSAVIVDNLRFGNVGTGSCKPGAGLSSVPGTFGPGWPVTSGSVNLTYRYGGDHRYLGNAYQGAVNWNNAGTPVHFSSTDSTEASVRFVDIDSPGDDWLGMTIAKDGCYGCTYSRNTILVNQAEMDKIGDFWRTKVMTHELGHALALRHPQDSGYTDKNALPSVMWQGELKYNTPKSYDTSRIDQLYKK